LLETEIEIEDGLNFTNPFYYAGDNISGNIPGISQAPVVFTNSGHSQSGVTSTLWSNFNFTGAFGTGLAYQTALTVNYLVVVENFPSAQDVLTYPLAKPPPCRDEIALSMYSCIMREMPVGVPVAENGFGEWFADAIANVADVVSPVLSAIPMPGTMAAGAALRAAGNVARGTQGYPTNPNSAPSMAMLPVAGASGSKSLTKLRNAETKARNAEVRARNEAIRAAKASKAAK
jgi:hypothetical protein